VTFAPNEALTAKVAAELKTTKSDFPLVINNYVAGFISYFTNSPGGHAHLLRSLERAGKYKEMISKNLQAQGVPQDLIYLAVAESGFQPQALNARSGAGGMWQFMPTGAYGLARNGWFDERFDPEKSSIAYAKYMKTLYNQFGDWYLAMAAYDWGPGNVQRAVMKTGYADFWELYRRNALPGETKNYVPGIIAAIIMAKNPEQYGLDKMVPEAAVISDMVSVDYTIDLRLVADLTGASLQEIVGLNPSLLRMTTPRDMMFDLHLPVGTKDAYADRIKDYTVRRGDTLVTVADRYNVTVEELRSWNHLQSSTVSAGKKLNITAPVKLGPVTRVRAKHARGAVGSASKKNAAAKNLKTKSGSATKATAQTVTPKKRSKGAR
jgi:membrane-bound lytic murein transglycosylase D